MNLLEKDLGSVLEDGAFLWNVNSGASEDLISAPVSLMCPWFHPKAALREYGMRLRMAA